jgi:hypothetical protein
VKRQRIYKPRRGIRFDNRRVQGPEGGFVGADAVNIITITGSVEQSATELTDTAFRLKRVPFVGYPKTPGQMAEATHGGIWTEAWFMEEFEGSLTGSFSGNVLFGPSGSATYRYPGPRFGDDDSAVVFSGSLFREFYHIPTETAPGVTTNTSSFWVTGSRSVVCAFVAKGQAQERLASDEFDSTFRFFCGNTSVSASFGMKGWTIAAWSMTGTTWLYPYQVEGQLYHFISFWVGGGADAATSPLLESETAFTPGNWFVCIGGWDRETSISFIGTRDLVTGATVMDFGAANGVPYIESTASFVIGGDGSTFPEPQDCAISALYLGVATGSAYDFTTEENLYAALDGLASVITARKGIVLTGTLGNDTNIGGFGVAAQTEFMKQKLLALGTASLGRTRGVVNITTGSVPSWTNRHIRNSAFVMTSLSSSDHESQVLGYYRSGTEGIENSPVPASRSLYYSKRTIPFVDPGTGFTRTSPITYSRTSGVVLNTGTFDQNNYALICRLTGALADLSGSAPGWLLNNQFGMPVIPLSSASLVPFVEQPIVTSHPNDILVVRPILDGARRLSDAARDVNAARTLIEQFNVATSGTAT